MNMEKIKSDTKTEYKSKETIKGTKNNGDEISIKTPFDRSKMIFLGEDDFIEGMVTKVNPYLKQYGKHGVFSSYDGSNLYYESYILPNPIANIIIVHGFCEFTIKFHEVIYQFLQAGYSVHILDHRGHGRSKRFVEDKGMVHIESYDEYVMDLHEFIHTIVIPQGKGNPLILFGHSMGGAISTLYLETYPKDITCAILSSPMLQINFGNIPDVLVNFVSTFAKLRLKAGEYVTGHTGYDGKYMFETSSALSKSRYDYIFQIREKDDNYQTYGANYHWIIASVKALRKIHKNAKYIQTPILLFQAENDTLVKAKGQDVFIKNIRNGKKSFFASAKHEIYNGDLNMRQEFFRQIFEFLDQYIK